MVESEYIKMILEKFDIEWEIVDEVKIVEDFFISELSVVWSVFKMF